MSEPQEEIRVGVFVCACGINIAGVVNTKKMVEYAKRLPGVVVADDYLSLCTTAGADFIKKFVVDNKINRIVIAA